VTSSKRITRLAPAPHEVSGSVVMQCTICLCVFLVVMLCHLCVTQRGSANVRSGVLSVSVACGTRGAPARIQLVHL
jgi:hypothetical protein